MAETQMVAAAADDGSTGGVTSPIQPVAAVRNRRFAWRRALILAMAVFCLAGLVGAGVVYWQLKSEPSYWRTHHQYLKSYSYTERKKQAEALERRVLAELSAMTNVSGPPSPKVLSITLSEMNAWISTRLKGWMKNQQMGLPKAITDPMIAIKEPQLIFAFRYQSEQFDQIVGLFFEITILDNGQARTLLKKISGGNLPLPAQTLSDMARVASPSEESPTEAGSPREDAALEQLGDVLDGVTFEPVMTIDQEKIRVLRVDLHADRVDLTIQIEHGDDELVGTDDGDGS